MENDQSAKVFIIIMAAVYGVRTLYTIGLQILTNYVIKTGNLDLLSDVSRVVSVANMILLGAFPAVILALLAVSFSGARRAALFLFAGDIVFTLLNLTLQNRVGIAALIITSLSALVMLSGFILLAVSAKKSCELRVCGIIAAAIYFIAGVMNFVTILQRILLHTGVDIFVLEQIMLWMLRFAVPVSITANLVMVLLFVLLYYDVKQESKDNT
jgi:hypothetical protein